MAISDREFLAMYGISLDLQDSLQNYQNERKTPSFSYGDISDKSQ